MRMGDRIAIMQAGRIEQLDSPAQVYARPATPFAARFLSETNEIRGRIAAGRLATPFGEVQAAGLTDGSPAMLMFRPEALQEQAEGVALTVERALALGPYRRLDLAGAGLRLAARLPPGPLPAAGSTLNFGLNRDYCFVFPAA
jgi:iron(III) transport system ATP-binding protein